MLSDYKHIIMKTSTKNRTLKWLKVNLASETMNADKMKEKTKLRRIRLKQKEHKTFNSFV